VVIKADDPDAGELRNFGLLLGAIIAGLFGGWPLLCHHAAPLWPWLVAGTLWLVALLAPMALRYVHRGWTRLGLVLGWINTRVILTVIYAISFVPLGVTMRLLGRDPMARRLDPACESYRVASRARPQKHMERPF
jgi:hypothetical protein